MTQFEYITATSGVYFCGCLGCFDAQYGGPSGFCAECESAGCEDYDTCQCEDVREEC